MLGRPVAAMSARRHAEPVNLCAYELHLKIAPDRKPPGRGSLAARAVASLRWWRFSVPHAISRWQ